MIQIEDISSSLVQIERDAKTLEKALDIEGKTKELKELNEKTLAADFYNDLEKSQKTLKKIKYLENITGDYKKIISASEDIATMIEMLKEEYDEDLCNEAMAECERIVAKISEKMLTTLLDGEYDSNNAIVTVHAGAGGTEAQDWALMLYRMYSRWAEKHDYKTTVLDMLDGEEAGIKSASLLVQGVNAYGFLKSEHGVHRLVRISPFDASGRRHTSFASIEIMPEIDDDVKIEINEDDLKVDTYRASGAGGQHVNKTESAIRITHIPTGVIVACQNERSQHKNREMAMKMLKSKLAQIMEQAHLEKIEDIKGEQMAIAWGSQIRSYVFMPYTMAKDHRTNFEVGNVMGVLDGDLDGFINAYLMDKTEK